jgi:hypothetical protein
VVCLGQPGKPTALAFGPPRPGDEAEPLAAAGPDGVVRVWDVRAAEGTFEEVRLAPRPPRLTLRGHSCPVRALAFSATAGGWPRPAATTGSCGGR